TSESRPAKGHAARVPAQAPDGHLVDHAVGTPDGGALRTCEGHSASRSTAGEIASVVDLLDGYPVDGDDVTVEIPTVQGVITVRLPRREFASLMATGGLAPLIPGLPEAAAPTVGSRPWPRGEDPADYFTRVLAEHQDSHHLLIPRDHIALLNQRLN